MSRAYTRARIDREATTEAGPLRFVAATEGRKDDGIDLQMSGVQLDRFRSNPVVLYGHNPGRPPIGRAVDVRVDGTQLLIDVQFDRADELGAAVERKYRDGFMSAVSIGFDVVTWGPKGNYWDGGVAEQWELLELSAVPVPMDAAALVQAGRALAQRLTNGERLYIPPEFDSELLGQVLLRELKRHQQPPPADVPPAPDITQGAAQIRAALDSFTTEGTSR